jgi:hypothetical protein
VADFQHEPSLRPSKALRAPEPLAHSARVGPKNKFTRQSAKRGTRPPERAEGRTASSNATPTFSTPAASPGTSSSRCLGKSSPSEQESGPIGHDQQDFGSAGRNRRLDSRGLGLADWAGASAVTLDPNLSWPMCSGAAHPCRRHDRAGSVAPTPPPNGPCTASPSAGDAGGHGAAVVTTPIEACESNDADPPAWRAHILAKPRDRPESRRDEWPPWNWTPRQQAIAEVA